MNKPLLLLFLISFSRATFAQPKINYTDAKGLKQGSWVKANAAGEKLYEGQFKDNLPIGIFKYYFPNGVLKATNNYFGKKSEYAAAHLYHTNGKLEAAGTYFEQKKDSTWRFFDEEENLISEEIYSKGNKIGNWKQFYPSGKLLRSENWKNNLKDGAWIMYYEDGKIQHEINYKDGKLEGEYKVFNAEGVAIIEGKYKNDNPAGNWFYNEGGGKVKYIEQYKDGKLLAKKMQNGVEEFTFPNGIPKSKYLYVGGKLNGAFVEYYNAGEYKRRRKAADPNSLDSANPTEEWEEVLDGQKVRMKGFYKDGKLEGEVSYFKPDGKLERKEVYVGGNLKK
jgi:antitoxin component YwqK of YwqJK toxin-antitoxin module